MLYASQKTTNRSMRTIDCILPFQGSRALSLGRVVPAPHTQHLLGPFAAIAQNSLLRSFSIVDSLANRQHSCRGSEELAIRKSARFQATPSYFAALRATPSGGRPRTPSYSEQLRAALSHSELRIGSIKLPGNRRKLDTPSCLNSEHSESELGAAKNSELFRAAPSYSERLLEPSELSEQLFKATRALRALRAATQSY